MDNSGSIFIKKKDAKNNIKNKTNKSNPLTDTYQETQTQSYISCISLAAIKETIPKGSFIVPQIRMKNMVEHRWRFLHIPTLNTQNNGIIKVVEISRKKPNEEREYINKNEEWIKKQVDPRYDQYVVEQYYYYTTE